MLVHVADVEPGRIGDPGDRAGSGRPPGPAGSRPRCRSGSSSDPAGLLVRSGVGKTFGSSWAAATSAGFRATSDRVPVVGSATYQEVPEPVIGRVQDPEAVGLRVDGGRGVGRPVDDRRVVERLHADRDVRRGRDQGRLAEGAVRLTFGSHAAIVVGVGHRRVLDVLGGRPEPRAVHPAARTRSCPRGRPGSGPACRRAASTGCRSRPSGWHPRSGRSRDVVGDEGLVLDDERGADAEVPGPAIARRGDRRACSVASVTT